MGLNVDHNLPLEAIEFPAEASTSNEEDLWKLYESKKEEKSQPGGSHSVTAAAEKPAKVTKQGKNLKRRATDEEQSDYAAKKPKRATKVRSGSKRVKT